MKKDPIIYIEHIDSCISRIKEYTDGIDEDGFLKNNLIQDAVIRNFEIIGEAAKKYDAFFSGQVTHQRREELVDAMSKLDNVLLNPTAGFTQGYDQKQYLQHFVESKLAPAPAGTATIDSFRFYEALEMLCLPIGDTKSSKGEQYDFWDFAMSKEVPVPKTSNWNELGIIMEEALLNYPANMHKAVSWWIRYKRDFAYKIMEEING